MGNNADLGITLQKMICDKYGIELHENAIKQFASNYNYEYEKGLQEIIDDIFNDLMLEPKVCLTYAPSESAIEKRSPHNFILENGQTLSIRTNKSGDKVAPRVVGQCGIESFNAHFAEIAGASISEKDEIKEVIVNHIDELFPIFLDYMFLSDFTVWVYENRYGVYEYEIISKYDISAIETNPEKFTFTRDLSAWKESTTLKYDNVSIAEIQIHKNRTFKFRFIMKGLLNFLVLNKATTETMGITAEKTICDMFSIVVPDSYVERSSFYLEQEMKPVVEEAFTKLPKPIESTGATPGERGANSKCSYDFLLEGGKTLSLKTNTGKMICPPEVGQPGADTCYYYFGHLTAAEAITDEVFKEMVLEHISEMVPIYLEHLLDSNYLLWIYKKKSEYHYKIFDKEFADRMKWYGNEFSFTKNSIEEWNESNTLKYKGVSIGEFQVHKSRACFKFRFNMENLEKIILDEE